jgi:molecular chaperone HtpG
MLTALGAGTGLINASYVHHEELLLAVPHLFGDVTVVQADLEAQLGVLADPAIEDRARTVALAARATQALAEVDVETVIKVLGDPATPSLYVADAEVLARVDLRRAAEIATGPWAGALRRAGERVDEVRASQGRHASRAQVCLNWGSPLIQRLSAIDDRAVFDRGIQLLYVQALLAGRRPLTDADRAIMSRSLDDLITLSVGLGDEGNDHV